jgi:hypothetical protein
MTMSMLPRFQSEVLPWLATLATWLLARSLSLPEPLVHATGVVVFGQLQAFEASVGKSLCPDRLARQFLAFCRAARWTLTQRAENHHDRFVSFAVPDPSCGRYLQRRLTIFIVVDAAAFAHLFNLRDARLRETGLLLIASTALPWSAGLQRANPHQTPSSSP